VYKVDSVFLTLIVGRSPLSVSVSEMLYLVFLLFKLRLYVYIHMYVKVLFGLRTLIPV